MSDIGYPIDTEVVVQSGDKQQTKPAGRDAYLAYNEGKDEYYLINTDEAGNPLGYIPLDRQ
jgi:hypothetical protein